MELPQGVRELTTYDEVLATWGPMFVTPFDPVPTDPNEPKGTVDFADDPRVVIAEDAIYVELKKPVPWGERVEEGTLIKIEEPPAGVLLAADKHTGPVARANAMISAHLGIPTQSLLKMPASDWKRLSDVVGRFLAG